jgi:hypothetical protein
MALVLSGTAKGSTTRCTKSLGSCEARKTKRAVAASEASEVSSFTLRYLGGTRPDFETVRSLGKWLISWGNGQFM